MPLKSIPAHGRAFVFRTAIGGGLAVEVTRSNSLVNQTTENWKLFHPIAIPCADRRHSPPVDAVCASPALMADASEMV